MIAKLRTKKAAAAATLIAVLLGVIGAVILLSMMFPEADRPGVVLGLLFIPPLIVGSIYALFGLGAAIDWAFRTLSEE